MQLSHCHFLAIGHEARHLSFQNFSSNSIYPLLSQRMWHQGNTHCSWISPQQEWKHHTAGINHFLSHGNPRSSTQLTLTKYLLNEWINETIDVKKHCKCQVCHYYFIFSLFFKAILKTGFPGSSQPPAMHMPGVCSGTNPVPAPRSYIAGLLVGDSWESGRVSCDKQITSGCMH